MQIQVNVGGELEREIRANCRFLGIAPEELLSMAPLVIDRAQRELKRRKGRLGFRTPGTYQALTLGSLHEFRRESTLQIIKGTADGDLGGAPISGLRFSLEVSSDTLAGARRRFGAATNEEAFAYAFWCLNQFVNTHREDCPSGIPCVFFESKPGVFEDIPVPGYPREGLETG